MLAPEEARQLLDSIDEGTHAGLRDRALIGLMVYTFARIGASTAMKVEDVYVQNRRLWVNLREKGGKFVALPCHHNLEAYLHAYLNGTGLTRGLSRWAFLLVKGADPAHSGSRIFNGLAGSRSRVPGSKTLFTWPT